MPALCKYDDEMDPLPADPPTPGDLSSTLQRSDGGDSLGTVIVAVGAHDSFLPTTQGNAHIVGNIARFVERGSSLKRLVESCFWQAGAGGGLDSTGLATFRSYLSQSIGVPEEAFGDLGTSYRRFKLTTAGLLGKQDAYKLVKLHLAEYRKNIAHRCSGVHIPNRIAAETEYDIVKEIACGSQGVVQLATDRQGELRCIKRITKTKDDTLQLDLLRNEFEIMYNLGAHPCISSVVEVFQDPMFYYLVQVYYSGGDFCQLRCNATGMEGHLVEDWWRTIFRQCFEGLAYLHEHAIMHCDIKEPNLMLKTKNYREPEVVIVDFGVAQMTAAERITIYGTPGYIAPEVWETKKWVPNSDVFSMGVVVMQLMTNKTSEISQQRQCGIFTENTSTIRQIATATRTRQPPFHLMPSQYSGLVELVRRLLEKNEFKRPCALEVLDDPWFCTTRLTVAEEVVGDSNVVGLTNSVGDARGEKTYAANGQFCARL